jgi:nickel-dependent lactate racemase
MEVTSPSCDISLAFGRESVSAQMPAKNLTGVLEPQVFREGRDARALVADALAHPVGTPSLGEMVHSGQRIAIVTSDMTRPCPSQQLVPFVLDELTAAGVPTRDVLVVVALGLHRRMAQRELEEALGRRVFQEVTVVNHDPSHTLHLGTTENGTPVEIFRPVAEADIRICIGNVDLHYFAGYSGGAKAILPGCASESAVTANHRLMTHLGSGTGRLEGNPVRFDLEQGVELLGVDFILNAVLDNRHQVVGAFAGDVIEAHRMACRMTAQRSRVPVQELADIVVAGAGGSPEDVNLYQAQKALDNAALAVRDGGIIILVGECREGLGNQIFEAWMRQAHSPDELLERLGQEFVLGGHKAAAIAKVTKRVEVYLVSAMLEETARACGMVPFGHLNDAVSAALEKAGSEAAVLVMPAAASTLPVLEPSGSRSPVILFRRSEPSDSTRQGG